MKRPSSPAAARGENEPFPDKDWLKRFPTLCAYLGDFFWDDGESRLPCTLSFKAQDGMVLASLSDPDLERGLYRTGNSCLGAVEALEKALTGGSADWRPWKQERRSNRKRD